MVRRGWISRQTQLFVLLKCDRPRFAVGGACRTNLGSSAGAADAIFGLLASDAWGPAHGRPAARPAGLLASDAWGPADRRPAARPSGWLASAARGPASGRP